MVSQHRLNDYLDDRLNPAMAGVVPAMARLTANSS
jgi:hypothetical protein